MIDIASLLQEKHLQRNYFAPDAYIQGVCGYGAIRIRSAYGGFQAGGSNFDDAEDRVDNILDFGCEAAIDY